MGDYIQWKYNLKHGHVAQATGFPWWTPLNRLSLNNAFRERHLAECYTRIWYHVKANDK